MICSDNGLEKHITGDSITIVAGSSHRLLVIVDRKQSVITWEFTTRGYDISFGIVKNDDLSDLPPEFASPLLAYSPDRVHSGSLTVNEPGRYILCWDNSHSWLREKTISYKVNVRKLERSVEEISSFSRYPPFFSVTCRKVYDTLCQEEEQLTRVTGSIETQISEREALKKRLTLLLQQMKVKKEEISSQEETLLKKNEEMEAIRSQREVLQQHADCEESKTCR